MFQNFTDSSDTRIEITSIQDRGDHHETIDMYAIVSQEDHQCNIDPFGGL